MTPVFLFSNNASTTLALTLSTTAATFGVPTIHSAVPTGLIAAPAGAQVSLANAPPAGQVRPGVPVIPTHAVRDPGVTMKHL